MAELIVVKVQNGDINKSLKQFKKRVMDSGHIQEYRDSREYLKPSAVKRKKKQHAIRVNYLQRMKKMDKLDV